MAVWKRYGTASVLLTMAALLPAQNSASPKLNVSDPAPQIRVESWIRGGPLMRFEKGKVYVLDFWATWCGGCIASFPHISAIAEKYKGRVTFVSVDAGEQFGEVKGDPLAKVNEFLQTPLGSNLKLNVCVDGTGDAMFGNWIKPLHRAGFPTTFVIDQDGKIAWVDVNLDNLDWVLGHVLNKSWDRDKSAAIAQQKDALDDMWMNLMRSHSADKKPIAQKLLAATDAFEGQFPDRTDVSGFYRVNALVELDPNKLPDVLEKMAANPLCRYVNLFDSNFLAMRTPNPSKRLYVALAKLQERLLQNEWPQTGYGGKSVKAYQQLADTYDKAGDPGAALGSMNKAIALANQRGESIGEIYKLQDDWKKYKASATGDSQRN